MAAQPLESAPRTYNTSHPDFHFWMTLNIAGKFFTHGPIEDALLNFPKNVPLKWYRSLVTRTRFRYVELGILILLDRLFSRWPGPTARPVLHGLASHRSLGRVSARFLKSELRACREELSSFAPYAELVERSRWLDRWVAELNDTSPGHFYSGSVPEDDGLFLYWLARRLRPKTIIQTGVCNGLSTAYMALGLEMNGGDGTIHAIDFPYVYDAQDPFFNQESVYGVIIPNGKRSGWIATEILGHRVEVTEGLAQDHLRRIVAEADTIDLFYHDSDHTYDHMTWEMETVHPHMREDGLIVCDDVGWNTATLDFARKLGVPAFNYRGSLGIVFL